MDRSSPPPKPLSAYTEKVRALALQLAMAIWDDDSAVEAANQIKGTFEADKYTDAQAAVMAPLLAAALAEERSESGEPVAGNQIRIGVALAEIEDAMDHFADQPLVLDRMSWTRTVREILEAAVGAVLDAMKYKPPLSSSYQNGFNDAVDRVRRELRAAVPSEGTALSHEMRERCVQWLQEEIRSAEEVIAHTSSSNAYRFQATVDRAREILSLLNEARAVPSEGSEERRDAERLDWLEGEYEREQRGLNREYLSAYISPTAPPLALFRRNKPITRAAIDAAIAATRTPDTPSEQAAP